MNHIYKIYCFRGRPKRVSDIGGAAVVEPKIATPTRQKRLSELVEPETKPASPARNRITHDMIYIKYLIYIQST